MRHDVSIPTDLHDGAAASVKDLLGAFWSSVFRDQDLVGSLLLARVLAAGQRHIDAMEALSLRDHAGSPALHREHWHPLVVRLSRRDTASVMRVGMPDTPVIGEQPDDEEVYLPKEVFVVGGNALYSKVYTYPIEGLGGGPLVRVATALCDSIASPRHILSQGRDFTVDDGVLAIRKEKDPFETDGYLVEGDGDDKVAVLWACDAEFDRDNVSDFLGYPLGLHAPSTEAASAMLSALWDAVTLGLTPSSLSRVLGAVFGVPVILHDTVVESVTADGQDSIVVTGDAVYRIETSRLPDAVKPGAELKAGSFLTGEITLYWGLSADDIARLEADGLLGRISLPPGSVAGVDGTVVVEACDGVLEDGGWFRLNGGDSPDSPFWRAVFARTTQAEREARFSALAGTGTPSPYREIGVPTIATENVRFLGWFTEPVGGTMVYDADGECVDGDYWRDGHYFKHADLMLYAHWGWVGSGEKYSLFFYRNCSGYSKDPGRYVAGLTYGGSGWYSIGTPTAPAGYTFLGWFTAPYGGTMVYDATGKCVDGDYWNSSRRYIHHGDLVVYAQWSGDGATAKKLTCNPNGGTYNGRTAATVVAAALVLGSGAYCSIGVPERIGYTFLGWFTEPVGGTMVYDADGECVSGMHWDPDKHYLYAGDFVVYAHWALRDSGYDITCNPTGGTYRGSTATTVLSAALTYATIDPLRAIGQVALANLILGRASRGLVPDTCAGLVLDFLHRLVPSYASLLVVQDVDATDGNDVLDLSAAEDVAVHAVSQPMTDDSAGSMSDSAYFRLIPIAATEV